jgi:hypothetical protein
VISSMARKRAAAKTSTINRATPIPPSGLERYCRSLDTWTARAQLDILGQ